MKRIIYILAGCVSLGVGAVGSLFPILPTVPFLMLAAYCFARSSEKLHAWFVGTKLYQDNLADFMAGKGMTKGAKLRVMVTVTLLMSIGFAMMALHRAVSIGAVFFLAIHIFLYRKRLA